MLNELIYELKSLANPEQAKNLSRYFKTGKGDYGEGDIFLGIKMPVLRTAIKKYINLPFNELQTLLNSRIHEHRMAALIIFVGR